MSLKQDVICRLCLKLPRNELVLIDEVSKRGFDVLSLRMNFHVSTDPSMCMNCMETINRSLSFILAYLNSEKSILLHNTVKNEENVDLRGSCVYNSKEIVHGDYHVCRFCLNKIEESDLVPLDAIIKGNVSLYMLKAFMFRMDPNVVENPLICFHCRDNVESYIEFLLKCHNTEEKIKMYRQNEGIRSGEKIMLNSVFQQFSKSTKEYPDSFIPVYEVKKEHTMEEVTDFTNNQQEFKEKFHTKHEEIDGSQNDYISCTCDTKDSSCLGCCARPNEVLPVTENIKHETVSLEMNSEFKIESEKWDIKNEEESEVTMYKCTTCDFQTTHENNFKKHSLTHKAGLKMYKCKDCNFRTKDENSIKIHCMTHKTEVEPTVYKCTVCDFDTIYKRSFSMHSLIHKTKSDVKMYKCIACDYKTICKSKLTGHSMTHHTEAEVTMYKCRSCDFKTISKNSLSSHSLVHKTEAEVTMHKCTVCGYKSRRKSHFNTHLLIHKTDLTMYKCMACDFKTKCKYSVKIHSLTHKTKAVIYKCTACDFKTVYKGCFTRHSQTHKTKVQLKTYKCMSCDYKTIYMCNIRKHLLSHKPKLEVRCRQWE